MLPRWAFLCLSPFHFFALKKFLFATLLAASALVVNAQTQPVNLSNVPGRSAHGFTDENEELLARNHGTGVHIGAAWTDARSSALTTHQMPGSFEVGVFHQHAFTRFASVQSELLYYRERTATTTRSGLRVPLLLVLNPFYNVSVHLGPQIQWRTATKSNGALLPATGDLANPELVHSSNARLSLAFTIGGEARVGFLRVGLRYAVPMSDLSDPSAVGKRAASAWQAGQVQAYLGAGF